MAVIQEKYPIPLYNQPSIDKDIDWGGLGKFLKHHFTALISLMLTGSILGSMLICAFYQENYQSNALLYLESETTQNLISPFGHQTPMPVEEVNPFKSNEEMLRSSYLLNKVFKALEEKHLASQIHSINALKSILNAQHLKGTKFIRLTASASTPSEAKAIADTYIEVYQSIAQNLDQTPLDERKKTLQEQINTTQESLNDISEKMRAYQEQNELVDVDSRSSELSKHSEDLKREIQSAEAEMAEKKAESVKIQAQLQLDPQSAINSVAKGQNDVLTKMAMELNDLEKEYQTKSLTYKPSHPYMARLSEKIAVLRDQIDQQLNATISASDGNNRIVIRDDVRRDMVKKLAMAEADYSALARKRVVNVSQLNAIEDTIKVFPTQKITYNHLDMEQKNLRVILDRLQQALADIKIAESYRSLYIYSMPSLPEKAAFPNRMHLIMSLILLSILAPLMLATCIYNLKRYMMPTVEYIQHCLHIPILCTIPWLPDEVSGLTHPDLIPAFQTLALSLKAKEQSFQCKALSIASVSSGPRKRSATTVNLALELAESGQKVALIDADIRNRSLSKTIDHVNQLESHSLTNLLVQINERIQEDSMLSQEELKSMVQAAMIQNALNPNLGFLSAGSNPRSSFGLFQSKGFEVLVGLLTEIYDWVLFDAPSILSCPETLAMSKYLAGMVLVVEQDATRKQVEKACGMVRDLNTTIAGAVVREAVL